MDWFEVASTPVSRDGVIQAIATIITALAAIGAGVWGVRIGSKTTREAALTSIEADREASRVAIQAELANQRAVYQQQRDDDDLAGLIALLAELRLNRQLAEDPISRWYPVPMERASFEQSLRLLATMCEVNQRAIERAWFAILAYNTVAAAARNASGTSAINELHNEGRTQAKAAIDPLDAAITAVSGEVNRRREDS